MKSLIDIMGPEATGDCTLYNIYQITSDCQRLYKFFKTRKTNVLLYRVKKLILLDEPDR